MVDSFYKKQDLRQYLLTSGILLIISSLIHLHYSIARAIALREITSELVIQIPQKDSIIGYPYVEHLIGIFFLLYAFVLITFILAMIGRVFDNEKRQSIVVITLLAIFILLEIIKEFLGDIIRLRNLWLSVSFLLVYAIFRGISFLQVKNQLNVPTNRFGEGFLGVYAWSFLFTQFVNFVLVIIITSSPNPVLVTNLEIAELWMNQNQIFLDTVAIGAIGLKFVIDGIKNPIIESKIPPRTAPDVDTRVELGMGQYKRKGMKRPSILDEYPLDDEE